MKHAMYATKKILITALATTLIATTGASATGALDGGFSAAYNLIAGFEVDATGAHELVMDANGEARANAQGAISSVQPNVCDQLYTVNSADMPDLSQDLARSESVQQHVDTNKEVDTGLVRVKAWSIGDVDATGYASAVTDEVPDKPQLDAPCSFEQDVTLPEADAEVPTKISHEQGFDGAYDAAADAAGDVAGSLDGDVGAQLP